MMLVDVCIIYLIYYVSTGDLSDCSLPTSYPEMPLIGDIEMVHHCNGLLLVDSYDADGIQMAERLRFPAPDNGSGACS